ncbi:hypothetical protein GP486_003353 [Trichoglossum hirsutum]|uniref:Uncharacterized protein n=1 Tax=Trichoglossum hirsutum TaxID=265104 RepID=A0A9P8LDD6_9PEZI|nr:hypothetical protein GP486_003353 [Trichoglossum hirsutum]
MEASLGFREASVAAVAAGLTVVVRGAEGVTGTAGCGCGDDAFGAGRSSVFTQSQVETYMFTLEGWRVSRLCEVKRKGQGRKEGRKKERKEYMIDLPVNTCASQPCVDSLGSESPRPKLRYIPRVEPRRAQQHTATELQSAVGGSDLQTRTDASGVKPVHRVHDLLRVRMSFKLHFGIMALSWEKSAFTYHSHGEGPRSYARHDFVDLVCVDSKAIESVWSG